MLVRPEVQDFVDAGPLLSEFEATEEQGAAIQFRLERIPRPVTDCEAAADDIWVQLLAGRVEGSS